MNIPVVIVIKLLNLKATVMIVSSFKFVFLQFTSPAL